MSKSSLFRFALAASAAVVLSGAAYAPASFAQASDPAAARIESFDAAVINDACRAIDLNGSLTQAWQRMTEAGIARLQSPDVLNTLS